MRLFGTDGIRGRAGEAPLDRETVRRVGAALARTRSGARVLIGRDTRESGSWIEEELARGLASGGASVVSAGVLPTPAIAYLTKTGPFDNGIVISASHNPFEDNGIKVFSHVGEKFTEASERQVEALVAGHAVDVPATAPAPIERLEVVGDYLDHLRLILPDAGTLRGSRVVIDCAHGATCGIAPAFFRSLGLDVEAIGTTPDGRNINLACGSTHLDAVRARVQATDARLGIAFDGDGDRALFVDADGRTVDGDAVMLLCALQRKADGQLPSETVVATVMSNIGLELALQQHGIALRRTSVGDKHVMEAMLTHGFALGGEQSGHVIFADHLFTGDGMATALHVLRVMAATGRELSELAGQLVSYPQVLVNVRVRERIDLATIPAVADVMRKVEARLHGQGRLLVRYSGTEPLLRVMIEGRDPHEIRAWADEIAASVRAHLG